MHMPGAADLPLSPRCNRMFSRQTDKELPGMHFHAGTYLKQTSSSASEKQVTCLFALSLSIAVEPGTYERPSGAFIERKKIA